MPELNTAPAPEVTPHSTAAVDAAITTRRSIRAFLPTPVPRSTVEEILAVASRAPSGTNIQPWVAVHVLMGEPKQALSAAILAAFNDPAQQGQHLEEAAYYPTQWVTPYVERRRKVGLDMYGLLGLGKQDKQGMHDQHGRNYLFFDAPVGLIFTMDRIMQTGSWLDYGMFLQSVMVAARGRGLHTCPQQAFAPFHKVIKQQLAMPENQMVVCGMALGYADHEAPVNRLVTERAPVSSFAQFHG
jgi:nitroreductase